MRLIKVEAPATVAQRCQPAGLIHLAMTQPGGAANGLRRAVTVHPLPLIGNQAIILQRRMVMALHHNQSVAGHVLVGHVPGQAGARGTAAEIEATALAEGVEGKAVMLAQGFAIQ